MIHHLAVAALLLAQAAPAERPCITHEEAGDMAVALLPFLIDAAAQRCRPHLAANAYLLNGAAEWSARLRRDSVPRRAAALRGIAKMGGVTPPAGAGNEATFDFIAQLATGSLTNDLQPENCGQIDTIAQSLSPLPSDNIARLVGAAAAFAMSTNREEQVAPGAAASEREDGDGPTICRS